MTSSLWQALSWLAPLPGREEPPAEEPVPETRLLALVAVLALLPGGALALAHQGLLQVGPALSPHHEALALLVLWALLGALRPLRGAAQTLGAGRKGPLSAGALSAVAGVMVVSLLVEREALALAVSIREDISYPGARLLLFWPVVGRWASLLGGQALPGARSGPFLLASGALLVLFFALLPPAFFLAVAPALIAGGAAGYAAHRWCEGVEPRAAADTAAGVGELFYLLGVAALAVRY